MTKPDAMLRIQKGQRPTLWMNEWLYRWYDVVWINWREICLGIVKKYNIQKLFFFILIRTLMLSSILLILMLGKIEGKRRRGWQRMRWLDGITNSMETRIQVCNTVLPTRGTMVYNTSLEVSHPANWDFLPIGEVVCVYLFATGSEKGLC